jgi:hypothetical protein
MALSLENEYRSAGSGLSLEFFSRVLPAARTYDRAAGFFASSVFAAAPESWKSFFEQGGQMNLVSSNRFSAEDAAALRSAVLERPRWRRREWKELAPSTSRRTDGPSLLSWLVANDRLALKIAHVLNGGSQSLYHEKIGLLADASGNAVAVSGSANETWNAWAGNFERIDTFVSWGGTPSR